MINTTTAPTAAPQISYAVAPEKKEETRKVAFICSKGTLDMAYPALIMGWAALGNGIDVTIFFTFWGLDMINKNRVDHLELAPVANTSMKMSMMGVPGNLGIPNIMGVLPGMTAFATNQPGEPMILSCPDRSPLLSRVFFFSFFGVFHLVIILVEVAASGGILDGKKNGRTTYGSAPVLGETRNMDEVAALYDAVFVP